MQKNSNKNTNMKDTSITSAIELCPRSVMEREVIPCMCEFREDDRRKYCVALNSTAFYRLLLLLLLLSSFPSWHIYIYIYHPIYVILLGIAKGQILKLIVLSMKADNKRGYARSVIMGPVCSSAFHTLAAYFDLMRQTQRSQVRGPRSTSDPLTCAACFVHFHLVT